MDEQRVLIVEDEEALQQIVRDVLEEAGFAVTASASADEAIELLQRQEAAFVALVTDIHLSRSGLTGWDVAKRARELNGMLPVIRGCSRRLAIEWRAEQRPRRQALCPGADRHGRHAPPQQREHNEFLSEVRHGSEALAAGGPRVCPADHGPAPRGTRPSTPQMGPLRTGLYKTGGSPAATSLALKACRSPACSARHLARTSSSWACSD
ncbi:MAG: response regulator [Caulobacteraceae bacterium]